MIHMQSLLINEFPLIKLNWKIVRRILLLEKEKNQSLYFSFISFDRYGTSLFSMIGTQTIFSMLLK